MRIWTCCHGHVLLQDWQWAEDVTASVSAMGADGFDIGENGRYRLARRCLLAPSRWMKAQVRLTLCSIDRRRWLCRPRVTQTAMLLLTDAYYPGWEATIDGGPGHIFQADGLFRAVFVPAGSHEITFTFNSSTFSIGGLVSLLGVLIWLVLVVTLIGLERFRMVRI
jgi:uncharacterized membrane protein YfhO